jgi:hypothetical protein
MLLERRYESIRVPGYTATALHESLGTGESGAVRFRVFAHEYEAQTVCRDCGDSGELAGSRY